MIRILTTIVVEGVAYESGELVAPADLPAGSLASMLRLGQCERVTPGEQKPAPPPVPPSQLKGGRREPARPALRPAAPVPPAPAPAPAPAPVETQATPPAPTADPVTTETDPKTPAKKA